MKQEYHPLTKEEYLSIKPGDVVERMLAFCIPMKLVVQNVTDDIIDCGWTFNRHTGLEVDEDIACTVSYISKIIKKEDLEENKE